MFDHDNQTAATAAPVTDETTSAASAQSGEPATSTHEIKLDEAPEKAATESLHEGALADPRAASQATSHQTSPEAGHAIAPAADAAAPAATPADGSKAPTAGAAQANDEKAWRKRFQSQRDQIARAEKELDVLQREEDKAQVQYYPDPKKALDEGYTRKDINEKDAKIAAKKDEIEKLKQGISDLEDELRKSGGDPGWSRE